MRLVNQTSYSDTLTAFRAAYGKGDSPDFVLLEDKETQQMIDSDAVVPAQACIDADDYDTSDFLTRVTDYFTVEDALWPMPFNVSNPVLYYNKALFTAAGLDPEQPPTTLEEITEASGDRRCRSRAARLGVEARPVAARAVDRDGRK